MSLRISFIYFQVQVWQSSTATQNKHNMHTCVIKQTGLMHFHFQIPNKAIF